MVFHHGIVTLIKTVGCLGQPRDSGQEESEEACGEGHHGVSAILPDCLCDQQTFLTCTAIPVKASPAHLLLT